MKKPKLQQKFLDELKRIPIVQVACEKVGLSRNSIYRWRNTDEKFAEEMDTAIAEGEALVNDMGESQLLSLIKEKNWQALSFWLRHRNPRFRDKLEVTATIKNKKVIMSAEQEFIVTRALKYASTPPADTTNQDNEHSHE